MGNKGVFTKILAIAGTVLVWFPILAPILIAKIFFIKERVFRFDYLMPAELFPAIVIGGALLIWAAIRAHAQLKLISWGLGIGVASLFVGQALAVATGLASGEIEPAGWPWMLVLASLVAFWLAIIAVAVGGVLLVRDLFKPDPLAVKSN
jgi:hypothetical protein